MDKNEKEKIAEWLSLKNDKNCNWVKCKCIENNIKLRREKIQLHKEIKELKKEYETLTEQNARMSQRHLNDSQKIKKLDKAMTYILQDLEVEKKGYSIEEMKESYLKRAEPNTIFIKNNS